RCRGVDEAERRRGVASRCGAGAGDGGRTALQRAQLPVDRSMTSMLFATLLHVLVYNIHAGKDAKGVDSLERVAALVKETAADVVLLQEVDRNTTRSGNVDQVATLTHLTGLYGEFGKSLDYQGGDYGIAILSRW